MYQNATNENVSMIVLTCGITTFDSRYACAEFALYNRLITKVDLTSLQENLHVISESDT